MPRLRLSRGGYTLVDDDDIEQLNKNKWYKASNGYARRGTKSKGKTTIHYLHRQVMGAGKGQYIDHINGDKLDNRKVNLRIVSQHVNGHNRHGLNKNNKSGYRGITYDQRRDKFVAEIWVNYRKKTKRFDTVEQAIEQRKLWEKELC